MANYLQISEQALDTDWTAYNYGTADIAAYSVVIIDGSTAHQISPANVIDGVAVGLTGILLHYRGSMEFQTETYPDLSGWKLFLKVVRAKSPPALAPGAMVQLGLLGLIATYRHPSLPAPDPRA